MPVRVVRVRRTRFRKTLDKVRLHLLIRRLWNYEPDIVDEIAAMVGLPDDQRMAAQLSEPERAFVRSINTLLEIVKPHREHAPDSIRTSIDWIEQSLKAEWDRAVRADLLRHQGKATDRPRICVTSMHVASQLMTVAEQIGADEHVSMGSAETLRRVSKEMYYKCITWHLI